jgi:hypothetical protein
VDGTVLTPGDTLQRIQGDSLSVSSSGDCGPSCGAGAVDIAVSLPPLRSPSNPQGFQRAPQVFSQPAAQLTLDELGTHGVVVSRACEDGTICDVELSVEVTPAPMSQPVDPSDIINACPTGCGDMPCLELSYTAQEDVAGEFEFNYAVLPADLVPMGTVLMFHLASSCYGACADPSLVTWQFTRADGQKEFYSGYGLYMLEFPLNEGAYSLCVTEEGGCLEGSYTAQRYFFFERL